MTNSVEIDRLSMDLDGLQLIRQKIIVDEMNVEGVPWFAEGQISRWVLLSGAKPLCGDKCIELQGN